MEICTCENPKPVTHPGEIGTVCQTCLKYYSVEHGSKKPKPNVLVVGAGMDGTTSYREAVFRGAGFILSQPTLLKQAAYADIGPREKPSHPCRLPGCGKSTTHNGGYCCPEHCREHRARK